MKHKNLAGMLATAFFLILSASAQAATISYTVGGPVVTGTDVDLQSINTVPFNTNRVHHLSGVGDLDLTGAAIVQGDFPLMYKAPENTGPDEHYLAVFGPLKKNAGPGEAVFSLNEGFTTFSFDWGSVDAYNSLTVVDMNDQTMTVSGNDLLSLATWIELGKSTAYFSITALAGIKEIILGSTLNAFEISNITVSSVPLPAALPMFMAGIAGLAFLRSRRKKSA